MRRGAPPVLRLDAARAPAFSRVAPGAHGLRFAPEDPPAGEAAPGPDLQPKAGAPVPAHEVIVVAAGRLVLAAAPGVARTLAAPDMRVIHDRRPPGLDRVAGASGANAGLLRADAGWRATVLPSLGDIVADLGPGPVAIRGDGRRIATARDGALWELEVGAEGASARLEETAEALAYAADGALIAASGGALRAAGGGPGGAGGAAPVVALATAAAAPRAAALHGDGSVSVWSCDGAPERLALWPAPLPSAAGIGMSPDGAEVALGSGAAAEAAAVVARAADGALVRRVAGARTLAFSPDGGGLAVAGDWGCAWLTRPEETT